MSRTNHSVFKYGHTNVDSPQLLTVSIVVSFHFWDINSDLSRVERNDKLIVFSCIALKRQFRELSRKTTSVALSR